jgi:hypothetical protein
MGTVARNLDLLFPVLAALAAILLVVGNRTPAGRVGAFFVFGLCH